MYVHTHAHRKCAIKFTYMRRIRNRIRTYFKSCALNFYIDSFCILALINSLGFSEQLIVFDLIHDLVWNCVFGFKRISKMPCIRSAEIAPTHGLCSCLAWNSGDFIHIFNDKLLVCFVQSLLFDVQVFLTISPNHLCISVCVFCDDLCSIRFIHIS